MKYLFNRLISFLAPLSLAAGFIGTTVSGNFIFVQVGIPAAIIINLYLYFQECPRCGKRPMQRNSLSAYTGPWHVLFPRVCDKCGYNFDEAN
jgi:hypothetical protein